MQWRGSLAYCHEVGDCVTKKNTVPSSWDKERWTFASVSSIWLCLTLPQTHLNINDLILGMVFPVFYLWSIVRHFEIYPLFRVGVTCMRRTRFVLYYKLYFLGFKLYWFSSPFITYYESFQYISEPSSIKSCSNKSARPALFNINRFVQTLGPIALIHIHASCFSYSQTSPAVISWRVSYIYYNSSFLVNEVRVSLIGHDERCVRTWYWTR